MTLGIETLRLPSRFVRSTMTKYKHDIQRAAIDVLRRWYDSREHLVVRDLKVALLQSGWAHIVTTFTEVKDTIRTERIHVEASKGSLFRSL